ncbi:rhodanese-like domain-containing protein [Elioraea sp.]|uniref:rhodanese-like domain-containing protein n=1 Tax=Elioraea sp. TaxID=2185103 RepID=UPI003F6FBDA3
MWRFFARPGSLIGRRALVASALLAVSSQRVAAEEIEPFEAWELVRADPRAILIDVATAPERAEDGVPDLSALGREVTLLAVLIGPGMAVEPAFVPAILSRFVPGHHRLVFICRAGVRSAAAVRAAREVGFADAVSVAGGMTGPDASDGRRGALTGWRAGGLPWRPE